MLRRVPVAVRLFGLVGLVILFSAAWFFCAARIAGPLEESILRNTEEVMLHGEKSKIKAAAHSMAVALGRALAGEQSDAGRKQLVRELVDPIRFEDDDSGYYFVYQGTTNIALPPRAELVGQDLRDLVDTAGVHYVQELHHQAASGGGYVAYIFPKPHGGEEHKLSYSEMIPGTDYWVGTGVYIDNVEREQARITGVIRGYFRQATAISAILFAAMVVVLCLLCLAIGYSVARPLVEATTAAECIAAGDFTVRLKADGQDEAARLQAALNKMTVILSQGIQEIRLRREEAEEKAGLAQEALGKARLAGQEVVAQSTLRLESLQKIAAAVAHQLRNPITIIGGLAGLLQKKPRCEVESKEYLDGIIGAAKRIERIAASVSAYGAIHMGRRVLTEAGDILEAGRQAGQEAARRLGIEVAWEIEGGQVSLLADKALLAMAVGELAVNAVESLPATGGTVRLTAGPEPDGASIMVADTGKGIPEADLQFLLDPFYSTKSVGVGMGLTKAQRVVQEHGGSLAISSQLGIGTQVTLHLPASAPEADHVFG